MMRSTALGRLGSSLRPKQVRYFQTSCLARAKPAPAVDPKKLVGDEMIEFYKRTKKEADRLPGSLGYKDSIKPGLRPADPNPYVLPNIPEKELRALKIQLKHDPTGFFGVPMPHMESNFNEARIENTMRERSESVREAKERLRREAGLTDVMYIDSTIRTRITQGGGMETVTSIYVGGNNNGYVGFGIGQAKNFQDSLQKAEEQILQNCIWIPRTAHFGISHNVKGKFNGTNIYIFRRPRGAGLMGGPLMYRILEMAGINDATIKMFGTNNRVSQIYAVFDALRQLQSVRDSAAGRGLKIYRMLDPGFIHEVPPMDAEIEAREKRIEELIDQVANRVNAEWPEDPLPEDDMPSLSRVYDEEVAKEEAMEVRNSKLADRITEYFNRVGLPEVDEEVMSKRWKPEDAEKSS